MIQDNRFIFYFSIVIVITILPKTGQNTKNTTLLHVKMTAFPAFPPGNSYQNRFLWTKWSKKDVHPYGQKTKNQLEHASSSPVTYERNAESINYNGKTLIHPKEWPD